MVEFKQRAIFEKICIDKFHILAANHYSSYVCDMFLKLSDIEDKKVLMSTLINFKNVNLLIAIIVQK